MDTAPVTENWSRIDCHVGGMVSFDLILVQIVSAYYNPPVERLGGGLG
jgi:hypothetical protein